MNDSELFELCKEVYKRFPDWNTGQWIDYHKGKFTIYTVSDNRYGDYVCPLLNSDYLLEKLPSPLIFNKNDCAIEVRRTKKDKYMWSANIRHSYGQYFKQIADTPLKALLKLTIALSEVGVKL